MFEKIFNRQSENNSGKNVLDPIEKSFSDFYGEELNEYSDSENDPTSGDFERLKKFKRDFPEEYELVKRMVDPSLSRDEFADLVEQMNEKGRSTAAPEGLYQSVNIPLQVPGRTLTVKFFQNRRVTISSRSEQEDNSTN